MKKTQPRDLATAILDRVENIPGVQERLLEETFSNNPHLSHRDRAFVMHLVQGVSRFRNRIDWIIGQVSRVPLKRLEPHLLNILRIALYQIFFLDRVPDSAAVNEAVKQAKHISRRTSGFVNGVLRQACRLKQEIPFPDREKDLLYYLSVYHSYPLWLVKQWAAEFAPLETEKLLEAGNRTPSLVLRTNLLRIGREELLERLRSEGISAEKTPYSPEGIRVTGMSGPVTSVDSFREGLFFVQGEAAQLVSHLLNPRCHQRVLDLCAGLGGKSTHLAELMGNKGQVVCVDSSCSRLISLSLSADRMGTGCLCPVRADAAKPLPFFSGCLFDKILVDGPCSGLGVISRHPDIKWTRTKAHIKKMAALQSRILDMAARSLARGGHLLYVTCTISREENEGVVRSFLRRNRDLVLQDLSVSAPGFCRDFIDRNGFFRTLPHRDGMDGFFAALFERK